MRHVDVFTDYPTDGHLYSAIAGDHLRRARHSGKWCAEMVRNGETIRPFSRARFAASSLRRALAALDRAIATD